MKAKMENLQEIFEMKIKLKINCLKYFAQEIFNVENLNWEI